MSVFGRSVVDPLRTTKQRGIASRLALQEFLTEFHGQMFGAIETVWEYPYDEKTAGIVRNKRGRG